MWIKSAIVAALLGVVLYKILAFVTFLRLNDTIFSHQPGPCSFVSVTSSNCADALGDSSNCADWAKTGECAANHKWMVKNCAKSCGHCENNEELVYGAEDFVELGNGKVLLSTGIKGNPDAFPHRKSQVYLFDFNKPHFGAVPVTFKDYTTEGFNPHGITAWSDKKGRVVVFIINHAVGETVERFEYNPTSNTLKHLESIAHSGFRDLNSLQATGERSFFFTNYAYFSHESSFSRLELLLMLRTAHVAHFEADHVTVESSGHFLANGIRASADNKYLYMAHMGDATLETFEIVEGSRLKHVHTLEVNTMIDNIHVDPKTADLWVGGFAKPALTINYMGDPANDTNHAPAQGKRPPAPAPEQDERMEETYEFVDETPLRRMPGTHHSPERLPLPPPPVVESQELYEDVDRKPLPPPPNTAPHKGPLPSPPKPGRGLPQTPALTSYAPPPPPTRPDSPQETYEVVNDRPSPPKTRGPPPLAIRAQKQQQQQPLPTPPIDDETYEMPEQEQAEYTEADDIEPIVRPSNTRPSAATPPAKPAVPKAVKSPLLQELAGMLGQGARMGVNTVTLNQIKTRRPALNTVFPPKKVEVPEKPVLDLSGGVRALAQRMEQAGIVSFNTAPKPPSSAFPTPAPPRAAAKPPSERKPLPIPQHTPQHTPPNSRPTTNNGYDMSSGLLDSRISTASSASSSSRDSTDTIIPPPLPRRDDPLPATPNIKADVIGKPWYRSDLGRDAAINAVRSSAKDGSFVIRDSARSLQQPFTLVILYRSLIKNIPIRRRSDTKFAFGNEKDNEASFYSISEMVDYHKGSAILLDGGGEVILRHAVTR